MRDFLDPPKTVVGQSDDRSGSEVMNIFDGLGGPRFHAPPIPIAEMTKFVDNSFHALKVTFGNEIGSLCAALGLDSYALMEIFLSDSKLNISPAYLRPAFAFGGSCLPRTSAHSTTLRADTMSKSPPFSQTYCPPTRN